MDFEDHGTAWDQEIGGQHALGDWGAVLPHQLWLRVGLQVRAQCLFQCFLAFFWKF